MTELHLTLYRHHLSRTITLDHRCNIIESYHVDYRHIITIFLLVYHLLWIYSIILDIRSVISLSRLKNVIRLTVSSHYFKDIRSSSLEE